MGLSDPRPLGVRKADGNGMPSTLKFFDETVNVGRRVRRWWSIIIGDENVHFESKRKDDGTDILLKTENGVNL